MAGNDAIGVLQGRYTVHYKPFDPRTFHPSEAGAVAGEFESDIGADLSQTCHHFECRQGYFGVGVLLEDLMYE